jgi:GTP-binding protein
MIVRSIQFQGSAASVKQFPVDGLPQIVLSGRSNVGKSSFINAMLNNFKVARVSQTPGKTRLLNFFLINESFYFVDIPGYGYANVNKSMIESFQVLIESYLLSDQPISLAVLLVDIRHKPSEDDRIMYDYYRRTDVPILVIATKTDKVSNNVRFNQIQIIKKTLGFSPTDEIIDFSAVSKKNVDAVWRKIEEYVSSNEVV